MMISLLNGILIKLGVLEQQLNVSAFNLNKSDCHISTYARRLGWEEKSCNQIQVHTLLDGKNIQEFIFKYTTCVFTHTRQDKQDNQICIYMYQSHGGVLTSFHVVAPSVFYISLCMIPDFCRPLYQVDSNKHSQLGLERKCSLIKCKFNAHKMTDHIIYGEICFAAVMGRREGMLTCLSCVSIRLTSAVKQSLTWQKKSFFPG